MILWYNCREMEPDFYTSFKEKSNMLDTLHKVVLSGEFPMSELLNKFYEILDDMAVNPDLLPKTIDVYYEILSRMEYPDVQKSIDYTYEKFPTIFLRSSYFLATLAETFPESYEYIFDKLSKDPKNYGDTAKSIIPILAKLTINAPAKHKDAFLDKFFKIAYAKHPMHYATIKDNIVSLFINMPDRRDLLFDKAVNFFDLNSAVEFTDIMLMLCSKMNDRVDKTFDFMVKNMENPNMKPETLANVVEYVGRFAHQPEYTEKVANVLHAIKKSKHIGHLTVLRAFARLNGNTDLLRSFVFFGERVPKSPEHPDSWRDAWSIPPDETCVFVLGGNGAVRPKQANGYLSPIDSFLQSQHVPGVKLYAEYHDFGDQKRDPVHAFNDATARIAFMKQHGRRVKQEVKPTFDDLNPQYVEQIFKSVFLPRISQDGKRLDFETACKNIRNITVVAHCHGGFTFLKIEELMQQALKDLGYSNFERLEIQKQLLCIAHAPYCPLGISKSTMISFISASDYNMHSYNQFEQMLRNLPKIPLSWFAGQHGNVFIAKKLYTPKYHTDSDSPEHNFYGYDIKAEELTQPGEIMTRFAGNALKNSLAGAMAGKPIGTVRELVTGGDPELEQEFDTAARHGDRIYGDMVTRAMEYAQPHRNNR